MQAKVMRHPLNKAINDRNEEVPLLEGQAGYVRCLHILLVGSGRPVGIGRCTARACPKPPPTCA